MNEYIRNIFNQFPEDIEVGNGITKEEVEFLEIELNVKLPISYKKFLMEFSYANLFGNDIFGYEPPVDTTVLYHTKKYIQSGLPRGFVLIMDVDEFVYCLNTNEMNEDFECPVMVYFPYGTSSYTVAYTSFLEFLENKIEEGLDNLD